MLKSTVFRWFRGLGGRNSDRHCIILPLMLTFWANKNNNPLLALSLSIHLKAKRERTSFIESFNLLALNCTQCIFIHWRESFEGWDSPNSNFKVFQGKNTNGRLKKSGLENIISEFWMMEASILSNPCQNWGQSNKN